MSSTGKAQATPPERGSFPLDHRGECKKTMKVSAHSSLASIGARADTAPVQLYMDCMKQESYGPGACRELSKAYLQCRMDTCAAAPRAPSRELLSRRAVRLAQRFDGEGQHG